MGMYTTYLVVTYEIKSKVIITDLGRSAVIILG